MLTQIIILFFILFFAFNYIWKNEWIKSLSFTICFIIALWINIPCFVSSSNLEQGNNLAEILFNLYAKFGILYIIVANILMSVVLLFQSKLTNKVEYSHSEIKKIYDSFGDDAVELYVIGKDLDFLYKEKYEKQTERIVHLKNHCKLLCEPTTEKELLDLYRKVSEQGVEIRFYEQKENVTNLKGQIKTDQSGIKKAIFTPRLNKKYLLISTDNQFLVSTILERCITVYEEKDL